MEVKIVQNFKPYILNFPSCQCIVVYEDRQSPESNHAYNFLTAILARKLAIKYCLVKIKPILDLSLVCIQFELMRRLTFD